MESFKSFSEGIKFGRPMFHISSTRSKLQTKPPNYNQYLEASLKDIEADAKKFKEEGRDDFVKLLRDIYRKRREEIPLVKKSGMSPQEREGVRNQAQGPFIESMPYYRLKETLDFYKTMHSRLKRKNPSDPLLDDIKTVLGKIVNRFKKGK